ncbi:MAG: hypothetical protein AAGG09_22615, partial [Pseudomonadota bacterium]
KARYQTDWLEPAVAFVSALSDHMAGLTPPHKVEARVNGGIRRLQRDTRLWCANRLAGRGAGA